MTAVGSHGSAFNGGGGLGANPSSLPDKLGLHVVKGH